jgi:uncharacterized protein
MHQGNLPSYIQHLLKPGIYPHAAEDIYLIQTHISFVIVAGSYVYKWKKPVNFGFLDFSTLEMRKLFCDQELVLNRRLCPDLYLDVAALTFSGQQYYLNGPGEVIEYAVKMARMPEERMMPKIIQAGELKKEHLDAIVKILVPFYEKAEAGPSLQEFGRSQAVAINVLENFAQTEKFIGTGGLTRAVYEKIAIYAREILADTERFDRRVQANRIRDCHGDLYSANICLAEKVLIFDCIEFNERFRYCDTAADVAFLAMDLDFHGLTGLSSYFIDRFIDESGDDGLKEMLNFYKCYRAYVRGKIGLFTAHDPAVDPQTAARCTEQAGKYFQLAAQYAEA